MFDFPFQAPSIWVKGKTSFGYFTLKFFKILCPVVKEHNSLSLLLSITNPPLHHFHTPSLEISTCYKEDTRKETGELHDLDF